MHGAAARREQCRQLTRELDAYRRHHKTMKCLKCQKPFAVGPDQLCADCSPIASDSAFADWTKSRGVWPMLTHEEIWRTAWKQAEENFRDLLDITEAELVAPNQNYRQGWQDAYANMKEAVAGGDNRSRLIIQKADDLAECLSSLLFDCVRYRMESSDTSYADAENAVAEYRRIIQHNANIQP
jgi:hypothetical protein